jgi:hypothetical protein
VNNTCAISSSISFLISAAISVFAQRLREQYDLDSTADSREQTPKASFVRSTGNFESDACSRILSQLDVQRLPRRSPAAAGPVFSAKGAALIDSLGQRPRK